MFGRPDKDFADPFFLDSTSYIPDSLQTALDYCGFLFYMNPQYQMASRRVVSHFITDIDFTGDAGDAEERSELYDYLIDGLLLKNVLAESGEEWAAYGNGMYRIHFPFDRFLIDRRDGKTSEYSLDMFGHDAQYDYKGLKYSVVDPRDPRSGKRVSLAFRDRKSTDMSRIKLRRLDPRRVTIMASHISGRNQYIYRFEEWLIRDVQANRMHQINETPICMLKAISQGKDFLFNEDEVYHLRQPTISGISNAGWGLPPTIANYRALHQLQVYRKIDEAVGLDYMLPFRMFSPNFGGEVSDATTSLLLGEWNGAISDIIHNRRKDMTAIHALPFPVTYQELGGQGKTLVPKDVIEFQTNDMLDGMGYPAELFRGSLAIQNMPTAIRLFEGVFSFLHTGLDGLVKWSVRRILDYLNREQIGVELQLPSLADNVEKQYLYMQLVASGEISRGRAFRAIGIKDPVEEAKARMDEDLEIEKSRTRKSQEFEREMAASTMQPEQAQQGAGGSMGADPSAGGQAVTPLDIMSQAQEIATQLLQMENVGERRKELDKLRASNPTLHAAVKENMEKMRSQAGSQGRQQVGQMAAQGAAA
jgi:hypothetical protein